MISPFSCNGLLSVTALGRDGSLPSLYSRTAPAEFDNSPKRFCFFRALELCFCFQEKTSAASQGHQFPSHRVYAFVRWTRTISPLAADFPAPRGSRVRR